MSASSVRDASVTANFSVVTLYTLELSLSYIWDISLWKHAETGGLTWPVSAGTVKTGQAEI